MKWLLLIVIMGSEPQVHEFDFWDIWTCQAAADWVNMVGSPTDPLPPTDPPATDPPATDNRISARCFFRGVPDD